MNVNNDDYKETSAAARAFGIGGEPADVVSEQPEMR
jgi:hypothetical protein